MTPEQKEKQKAYYKAWSATEKGKACIRKGCDKWYREHKDEVRQATAKRNEKVKRIVFEHYGGTPPVCACCGEDGYVFLTVDHKLGDGAAHRRALSKSGWDLYRWLHKEYKTNQRWPTTFQILCHNCNFAKGNGLLCPHQTGETHKSRTLKTMIEIPLTHNEITSPGLYIMRWQGKTGLARIVGEPKTGYRLINPENPKETLMSGLPAEGGIPKDALFSQPLALNVVA